MARQTTLAASNPQLQTRAARDAHLSALVALRDADRTNPPAPDRNWSADMREYWQDRASYEDELSAWRDRTAVNGGQDGAA
jgi:hypothetical protein